MHQPVGILRRKRKCASYARTGGFAAAKPPQQGTGLDCQSGAKGILAVGGIYPVGTARVAWVVKPNKYIYPFQTRRIRNPACPQLESVYQLGGEGQERPSENRSTVFQTAFCRSCRVWRKPRTRFAVFGFASHGCLGGGGNKRPGRLKTQLRRSQNLLSGKFSLPHPS